VVTHGHLSENDNHGGRRLPGLDDPLRMLSGIGAASVAVEDFVYGRGDLSVTTAAGRPPTVREGGTLTFRNLDSPRSGDPNRAVYHTITSCRAPGNRETGIAYPLADGPVVFDSSEPGFGPPGGHRRGEPPTWRTPKDLAPGTYTYFCRAHPFMRGAFRVVPR
jgi:hypothetical protein